MPRRRVGDKHEAVEQFAREIETEYDVALSWEYSARPEISASPRALATCTAYPLAWSDLPMGRWFVSGEIITTAKGVGELKAHLKILSTLMMDLQMCRSYGVKECEYFARLVK